MSGFGKPKYGGDSNFKDTKLKEGRTVVRILPPMNELAADGTWAVYAGIHFGYKGVNARDRSKPTHRPFQCIEEKDFKTMMLTQDCPECDNIAAAEKERESLETQLVAEGKTKEQIKEELEPIVSWLKEHNVDRKWAMHAKLPDGTFTILKIPHKTKKLLEKEIARVIAEDGVDPLHPEQGVWFCFERSGKGKDTQDTVTVEYESVKEGGRIIRTLKLAPLTEADEAKAVKECRNLKMLNTKISYEQIKMLVECSGGDEDVDKIFAIGEKKKEASARPAARTLPSTAPKPAPEPTPEPAAQPAAEPSLEEQMEALKAKMAAAKAAAPAPAAPAASQPAPQAAAAPPPAAEPAKPVGGGGGLPVDRAAFAARFAKPKV